MSKRPSTADRDPSVTDPGNGDQFLSRWARRKALARRGGDPDAAAGEPSHEADTVAEAAPSGGEVVPQGGESQAPELTDADMPALESIDENTDMSGFFSSKVSQAVKKAALRKFFHNPAFNIVDGLDDYDDDFRSFQALGDIVTSDMRSQMDREAERARAGAENPEQGSEAPVSEQARSEEARDEEETDEAGMASAPPAASADDDADTRATADPQPGVTREPGHRAHFGHGKLRPRDAAEDEA